MGFCIYCMKEIKEDARFCPHCGKEQSAQPLEHQLPPGTVLGRKYRVGAVIGEGGFGITYVGLDTALNLRVAIKEFFPYGFVNRMASVSSTVSCSADADKTEFFQKGKLRFMQEAQTLAKFSGARGIVEVRDFFEENNTAYIVMEYLDGVTLKQYLKDHGTLSPEETVALLTPVMVSLQRLHKENLIHRDISPDNIMLVEDGVKLLDFGAARSVGEDQKSLSVMLKQGYAPIEQYQSHGIQGPWTDVYALCATMYRCMTGVRLQEATERLDEDTLLPPSALGIPIDPQTEAALMKGLEVKARNRWQSVDELLEALTTKPKSEPNPTEDKTKVVLSSEKQETPEEETPEKSASTKGLVSGKHEASITPDNSGKTISDKKGKRGLKIALGVIVLLFVFSFFYYKIQDNSVKQRNLTTKKPDIEETTIDGPTVEDTTVNPLAENSIVYESESFRPVAMDTNEILQLYTDTVNNVKKRCPGFTKKDDQNYSDVQAGSGDSQIANRILNLVATEVLKSAAGESDVSKVAPHEDLKVLNNFPIYGQEYACGLTELSMLKSAACYTDGERYKIVLTVQDTSNAEPVTSEFGKIMTSVRREEITEQITKYFVMLDNEKFKFDLHYTGNEIICVFNKESGELEYLSQKMIINIDINLDMDLVIFSTDFVKATGKVISHIEYTDFDWS